MKKGKRKGAKARAQQQPGEIARADSPAAREAAAMEDAARSGDDEALHAGAQPDKPYGVLEPVDDMNAVPGEEPTEYYHTMQDAMNTLREDDPDEWRRKARGEGNGETGEADGTGERDEAATDGRKPDGSSVEEAPTDGEMNGGAPDENDEQDGGEPGAETHDGMTDEAAPEEETPRLSEASARQRREQSRRDLRHAKTRRHAAKRLHTPDIGNTGCRSSGIPCALRLACWPA